MSASTERGQTPQTVQLAVAAGLSGAALASVDGCVAMLAGGVLGNPETAWFLAQGAAVLCLVSFAAFFATNLILAAVARFFDRSALPLIAGCAAGVILVEFLLVVADLWTLEAWTPFDLLMAVVLVLFAVAVGLLTYVAAKHASPKAISAGAATFTAYSLIGFAFVWMQMFLIEGTLSFASIVLSCVCGLLGLGMPLLTARRSAGAATFFAVVPLGLAVVAVGMLFTPHTDSVRMAGGARKINRILLVSIDTLRADHLSAYNPEARQTPHLDRLAREGVLFRNSYSLSSWTLPSLASIMTGLPPRYHGANRANPNLDDAMLTLAEHLQAAGYRTAAIGLNPHVAYTNFAQGFDRFQFYPLRTPSPRSAATCLLAAMLPMRYKNEPSSTELTDLAIDWLRENSSQTFFLWLHYLDPHVPYELPADRRPDNPQARQIIEESRKLASAVRAGRALTAEQRSIVKDLYAREVQYVDDEIGRLIGALEDLGIYEDSLIIVTSDHGEELWDHDAYEHGHALHEELIRVPLLVRGAGLTPQVREERVGNHSILPTVLSLAGIENSDPWQSQTPSLFPAPGTENQTLFVGASLYYADQNAVLWDLSKCIDTIESGRRQIYDLEDRPVSDPEKLAACDQLLGAYATQADNILAHYGLRRENRRELDEAAKDRLRSLGYIH